MFPVDDEFGDKTALYRVGEQLMGISRLLATGSCKGGEGCDGALCAFLISSGRADECVNEAVRKLREDPGAATMREIGLI